MSNETDLYKQGAEVVADLVANLAGRLGVSPSVVLGSITKDARRILGDQRNMDWRVRVRLYCEADNFAEPIADSDPELPPDATGTEVVSGLPAVGDYLSQLASAYHDQPCNGLSVPALDHRLKSLRPTLSRKNGVATWRVPYSTLETMGAGQIERKWLARADIERVEA